MVPSVGLVDILVFKEVPDFRATLGTYPRQGWLHNSIAALHCADYRERSNCLWTILGSSLGLPMICFWTWKLSSHKGYPAHFYCIRTAVSECAAWRKTHMQGSKCRKNTLRRVAQNIPTGAGRTCCLGQVALLEVASNGPARSAHAVGARVLYQAQLAHEAVHLQVWSSSLPMHVQRTLFCRSSGFCALDMTGIGARFSMQVFEQQLTRRFVAPTSAQYCYIVMQTICPYLSECNLSARQNYRCGIEQGNRGEVGSMGIRGGLARAESQETLSF